MKIFNIKLDLHKISYIFIVCIIILLSIFLVNLLLKNQTIHMNSENYTTILRDSHQNISKFVGKKIITSGYVFRADNFEKNRFVIARDMIVGESEASIVGFLCEYEHATDFENNVWVEAHGTISLGNYYGPMPIIKIDTIKKITTPNDVFVYPPSRNMMFNKD